MIPRLRRLDEAEQVQLDHEMAEYKQKRERLLAEWRAAHPDEEFRPTCRTEEHRWAITFEDENYSMACLDAHSEDELAQMNLRQTRPGCALERHELGGEIEVTLGWKTTCPGQGTHGFEVTHGYNCDCDHWAAIKSVRLAA